MAKIYIETLGCKVNSYDGDALESSFKAKGYQIVHQPDQADITILNSCSVTAKADRDSRNLLKRYKRKNPKGMVVATGCYAQTDSAALVKLKEVDWVIPNEKKQELVDLIHEQTSGGDGPKRLDQSTKMPVGVKEVEENRQGHFKTSLKMAASNSSKTRAFLKVQDGCNGFCTYCLIPYARGQSRSVPYEEILQEIRRQIDQGTKEIVLTGIHIGDYGRDLYPSRKDPFSDLIKEVMDWDDMVRLRISSLEPKELSENLLKVLSQRSDKFCDHFHMPLQSGHDRILKLMRRSYDTSIFADKVSMAKDYFPNAFFGTDVIPGFPSETDEEASATEDFIKEIGMHELHVFPYSKRPNTAAIKMPGHLHGDVVKARARSLRELSKALKASYTKRFTHSIREVLWENRYTSTGQIKGRTRNYLEVVAPSGANLNVGQMSAVRIKGYHSPDLLFGQPLEAMSNRQGQC